MKRMWSRWKIWLLFLLVVVGTALVVIPRAEGAGTDLFSSGDYAGALAAFEKELGETTGPAQAPVLNNIGTCYMALGKPDLAAGSYQKAVDLDPGYGRGWINLGVALEKLGRPEEALTSYGRVSDSGDKDLTAEANVKKGTLLAGSGRFDEAIAAFEFAEGDAKGQVAVDMYTGIGGVKFMKNDITAAEMAFLNAIEADPSGAAMAYTNLGVIRIAQNRYAEAKSAFETAISHDPQGKTKAARYLKKLEGMGVV
nr:tetratricopeptide repeat protein [uncultured Methanospirillum sp.]